MDWTRPDCGLRRMIRERIHAGTYKDFTKSKKAGSAPIRLARLLRHSRDMTGGETPVAILFDQRIGELDNLVDRFAVVDALQCRATCDDSCGIAINPHL